jgi:acyl-CoA synthetase (AMP-forming)/AMP-acid ligase II
VTSPPRMSQTLDDLIARQASVAPTRPALVSRHRTITYGELGPLVGRLAGQLTEAGVGEGHKVALVTMTSPEQVLALLAALRCGAMVSALSAALSESDRERRLAAFDPDLVVGPDVSSGTITAHASRRQRVGWPRSLVFWTGGSTGFPKGVVLRESGVVWNATTNAEVLGLRREDRAIVILDGAYCYAMVHQVFSHLAVGASIAWPDHPLWLPHLAATIRALEPTTLAVVPAVLHAIVSVPAIVTACASLRLVTVGGGAASAALLARARTAFPAVDLRITYGLTEAGPRVCTHSYDPAVAGRGIVGRPMPGVQVRVSAAELLVRTPSRAVGYMVAGRVKPSSGWLRTGDLGSVEPGGEVRIAGRLKRVINRGGIKIQLEDIETALRGHPDIVEARVVAFEHPRLGEVPRAYIVAAPGGRLDPDSVARYCLERLKLTATPVDIRVVERLPPAPVNWKEQQVDVPAVLPGGTPSAAGQAQPAGHPAPAGNPTTHTPDCAGRGPIWPVDTGVSRGAAFARRSARAAAD